MKKTTMLLVTLALSLASSVAGEIFKAYDTSVCDGQINPEGYQLDDLSFSWKLPSSKKGISQGAYRIKVATSPEKLDNPDVWDSGKIVGAQSVAVPYGGRAAKSGEKLWWSVIVWDEKNAESESSDPSFFEAAPISKDDWKGSWISGDKSPSYFRAAFNPEMTKAKTARLRIASASRYVAYINGEVVADIIPSKNGKIRSDVFDIARFFRRGENTIEIVAAGKDKPRVLAQIDVFHLNGSVISVFSNEDWRVSHGGLLRVDRQGEEFDARLEPFGWHAHDFDDSAWNVPSVRPVLEDFCARESYQTVIRDTLSPVDVKNLGDGVYIFDIGQNIAGCARLSSSGENGQKITVRYSEHLSRDGKLSEPIMEDTYICAGGSFVWEPFFAYRSFRYVEVKGLPEGGVPIDTIVGLSKYPDMPLIGYFVCSNPKINRLQSNIQWGMRADFDRMFYNLSEKDFLDRFSECANFFCETAAFNMNVCADYARLLKRMRDAGFTDSDAIVFCPWSIYISNGNPKILRDNFDSMKIRANLRASAKNRSLFDAAYSVRCADIVAKTAEILGAIKDKEYYTEMARCQRKEFVRAYVDAKTAKVGNGTPSEYIVALAYDIIPEKLRSISFDNFLRAFDENKNLTCDTLPLINPVLTKFGKFDTKFFKDDNFPWLASVSRGDTNIREGKSALYSYALGSIGSWLYSQIAGLAPDPKQAGYKNIIFAPKPDKSMRYASARHMTPYGDASSMWKYTDGVLEWKISIPSNSTGTVVFPTKKFDTIRLDGFPLSSDIPFDSFGYPVLNDIKSGEHQILLRL